MPRRLLTRRRVLHGLGAGLVAAPAILKGLRSEASDLPSSLFTLGVMSGDPGADHVTLWTRLAPDPLNGGGMKSAPVFVRWQVARDPAMQDVIRSGSSFALPRNGHAVRVLLRRLPSDSWLYYRFEALGEWSRVGRTRTFPGPRDRADSLRFALASCQDYEDGFYPAWRDIAQQDLDFVVHVGDYIYEGAADSTPTAPGRMHNGPEVFSVEDYRNRYALYRLDRDLQEAQARFPLIHTPDDHEVDNNFAGRLAEEDAPFQGDDFLERRRNAYRVLAESMPYGPGIGRSLGRGPIRLFRRLDFGDLASFFVLDTRQFRSDQPAEDGFGSTDPDSLAIEPVFDEAIFDPAIDAPEATLLGGLQERWLKWGLGRSRAHWNVLAQQVLMTEWNLVATARATIELDPEIPPEQKEQILPLIDRVDQVLNVDAWDGYRAARERIFRVLESRRPSNPVVLTGDIHSAWGSNLLQDFAAPDSDLLAAEFVCTSISSGFGGGDPRPTDFVVKRGLAGTNPQIEFFNGLFRGYCLCELDRRRWRTTYRSVGTLADAANTADPRALVPRADSPVVTDAVLEIESGFNRPGSDKRLTTTFSQLPAS